MTFVAEKMVSGTPPVFWAVKSLFFAPIEFLSFFVTLCRPLATQLLYGRAVPIETVFCAVVGEIVMSAILSSLFVFLLLLAIDLLTAPRTC